MTQETNGRTEGLSQFTHQHHTNQHHSHPHHDHHDHHPHRDRKNGEECQPFPSPKQAEHREMRYDMKPANSPDFQ